MSRIPNGIIYDTSIGPINRQATLKRKSDECAEARAATCVQTQLASRVLFDLTNIPFMSQQLEYQERFNRLVHEAVVTSMVISPDGRRLVTASNDSTVLVWSTRSGVALCRFKAHSPILSLAWVRNSKGILFGCKNGMLASVDITEVRSYEFG